MAQSLSQGVEAIANQWADVNLNGVNQGPYTSNTFNKVPFNNVRDNPDGAFDPTTNFRFQPTLSGIYLVTAQIHFSSSGNDILDAVAAIYRNGSALFQGQQFFANANGQALSDYVSTVSALLKLNGSTNYVEIFGYCLNNAAPSYTVVGTNTDTWAQFLYVGTFRRQ